MAQPLAALQLAAGSSECVLRASAGEGRQATIGAGWKVTLLDLERVLLAFIDLAPHYSVCQENNAVASASQAACVA